MPRIALTLIFLVLIWPMASFAQTSPAYTVNDVKVDIVAETAVKARDEAFAAAQEQAFKMLSLRFLPPEQQQGFKPPEPAVVSGMVSDFEITSEQASKRRYLGAYIFRFKSGPVNRFFGHGPLSNYQDTTSNTILILPVFVQKGEAALWETGKNPWLEIWQKQDPDAAMLIPQGNISDTIDIRDSSPEKISQVGIKRIRARYNVNDVVILAANFDQSAPDALTVSLYRTDRGRSELVETIPVPVGNAKTLGDLLLQAIPQTKTILSGNWKGIVAATDLTAPSSDYQPQSQTPQPAEQEQAAPYKPQSGLAKANVSFNTISDWLAIRRSLNGVPSLTSIRILSLATNQATVELGYSDWSSLTNALSAKGLSLQAAGSGEYNLIRIPNRTTGYPQ